ncbi:MAG TPA: hypothetical protein VJ776_09240, partial [Thermoanaerobaculia bacterium]|nr:hypothetical protein [Thermoanaerobaculia bacterium]
RRFRPSRALLVAAVSAGLVFGILTFFAGLRVQARRDREAPPPPTKTLTFRRGFLTGARFAPDGQTIVYSAAWDGKPSEIFTTRVGSSESRPLGIFPAGVLAISSAGELAISLGCKNRWEPCFGTLARVPLAGGTPREVLDNVGSADWSPDGKELAAIHALEDGDRIEYPIGKMLCKTDGTFTSLRVSPKGDLVAFIEHPQNDTRGAVCVVDRAGRKKNLTGQWLRILFTLWSPSGEEVFFQGIKGDIGMKTWGVNLAGRVRAAPWIPGLQDVSRDGVVLDTGAYGHVRRDILAWVPGASREVNLSWLAQSDAAALSRDGRNLLFSEENYDSASESWTTYLRRTDGSDAKLLGEGKALALSSDEKWALVFRPSPSPHLALLPAGVGEPRDLTAGAVLQYHWVSFFPDGRRILIAAQEKGKPPRTYIQDLSGGPPRPFAEEGMWATLISPDGREIAGSTLEGLHLIYRADGEGRARAIVGADPGDLLVQWSADGKSILVRGAETLPLTLYRIDLESGRRERWKKLAPPDIAGFMEFEPGPTGVRVTPDFQFYAYTFYSDLENLRMTEVGKSWWK